MLLPTSLSPAQPPRQPPPGYGPAASLLGGPAQGALGAEALEGELGGILAAAAAAWQVGAGAMHAVLCTP